MSDEQQGGAQDVTQTNQLTGTQQTGKLDDLPGWAQTMIRELRDEAAARRVALNEAKAAQQQRLAEEGKWKELAEARAAELAGLTPFKERADTLEQMIRASNSARINTVREDMRALIPVDYPPEKLATWLDANIARLTTPPAPNIDAGAGASGGGSRLPTLTPEQVEMAKIARMTPAQYAEMLAKRAAK